jgi:hypothetical protein
LGLIYERIAHENAPGVTGLRQRIVTGPWSCKNAVMVSIDTASRPELFRNGRWMDMGGDYAYALITASSGLMPMKIFSILVETKDRETGSCSRVFVTQSIGGINARAEYLTAAKDPSSCCGTSGVVTKGCFICDRQHSFKV